MVVGLLLSQPENLLDPGPQTGQRRAAVLLELLVGIGEFLLDGTESLLGLAQPALGLVHPLLGLGPELLSLGDGGRQPLDVGVHLGAVVTAQDNTELSATSGVVKERKGGWLLRLLGHWHIVSDAPGASASP